MRVKYHTIMGGFYTGELIGVYVPVERLKHINGANVEISGYDIKIKLDDGAKVTFENVNLNEVYAITDCLECKHCVKEELDVTDREWNAYCCAFSKNGEVTFRDNKRVKLSTSDSCLFWEKENGKEDEDELKERKSEIKERLKEIAGEIGGCGVFILR